jgi:hypothetical protein
MFSRTDHDYTCSLAAAGIVGSVSVGVAQVE